jgi:hypothetical protein
VKPTTATIEDATITADDLLDALGKADVLEAFCQLPDEDQAKFSRWIGMGANEDAHWRRINAFISALESSPLA